MFINLPKIELHCHLDGSVRVGTIIDIARKENIEIPSFEIEDLTDIITVKETCECLNDYLKKFEITNSIMQSRYSLERITYELLEDVSKENIKYIEIRFAPQLHRQKGLTYEEILETVINGIKRGEKDFDIKANLIVSFMRILSVESGMELLEVSKNYLNNGIVGFDLAGPENEGFCEEYKDLIKKAKEYKFGITLHAGEQGSYQNVIDAVNIGATRIGHGIKIINSKEAYDLVKDKNILLEMCPTSNVQTKNAKDFKSYPFYEFFKDGVIASLNTDNRTMSGIDLTNEYQVLFDDLDYTEYKEMYLKTVNAIFADEETKRWLRSFI